MLNRHVHIKCAVRLCLISVLSSSVASTVLAQNGLPVEYKGPTDGEYFGHCVISGRDVDGDGYDDILASDHTFRINDQRVGRSIMVSGRDGSELWRFDGPQPLESGTLFYITSTFIADIDGDQFDEVAIGTPGAGHAEGRVDVLSGLTGEVLYSFVGQPGDLLGRDVGDVGDVNGDGTDDFGFVAGYRQAGVVSIRSGRDASELLALSRSWPRRVAGIGDVDGDRHDDVAVGAWYKQFGQGITVYSGDDGSIIHDLDPPDESDDMFGWSVVGGVDFTGDDRPDFVASGTKSGRAYLFNGATGQVERTLHPTRGVLFGATLLLGDVTGDGMVNICISDLPSLLVFDFAFDQWIHASSPITIANGAIFGDEMALGDINGDGILDFVVGQSSGPGSVKVDAGSPLMLSPSGPYHSLGRGDDSFTLRLFHRTPRRTVYVLGSRRGIECTPLRNLNICIDLRRPLNVVGTTVTDDDGFGTIELEPRADIPLGTVYLQALDPDNPIYGPLTSAVLQITVRE